MSEFNFPTEVVELPSKGLVYHENNPLSSGKVEMKYMTAKEEDILTNQNYLENGTVLDKLLQSLIVSKVNYKDLVVGDKNALLIAARILGYGGEYIINYKGEEVVVDLSKLENKVIDESLFQQGKNEFEFELPTTKNIVTFKLLTHSDEFNIEREINGLKKLNKTASPEVSTRLKHTIIAIDGDTDKKTIRNFVDNQFLARDAREFRKYVNQIQPDVDLTTQIELLNGNVEDVDIPISINFFWPDATI